MRHAPPGARKRSVDTPSSPPRRRSTAAAEIDSATVVRFTIDLSRLIDNDTVSRVICYDDVVRDDNTTTRDVCVCVCVCARTRLGHASVMIFM